MQINNFKVANSATVREEQLGRPIAKVLELENSNEKQQTIKSNKKDSQDNELRKLSEILNSDVPTSQIPLATDNIKSRPLSAGEDKGRNEKQNIKSMISKIFDDLKNGKTNQNDLKSNLNELLSRAKNSLGIFINKYA